MRIPSHRIAMLQPLLFLALFAFLPSSGLSSDFLLHCQWQCPNTHKPQTITFADKPLVAVLPGGTVQVTASLDRHPARITVLKNGVAVSRDQTLSFSAPDKPGAHYISLVVESSDKREEKELCILVPYKASAKKSGKGLTVFVDGEEVGEYRLPASSGSRKVKGNPDSYQPPVWWLRITPSNSEFSVVPGVKTSELVAITEETGLRHTDLVPISYPMWRAIVSLRVALEKKGIPGRALKLISMFRTPPYNRMIGSNSFGRHVYGDAFDFYIDLSGSGKAADLNRNGKLDHRDAYPIVALIEELQSEGKIPMGGIGVYNTQGGDHEVTMHLDMRGHRATWCFVTSPSGKKTERPWASRHFAELDRQDEMINAQKAAAEKRRYSPPRREPLP